MRDRYPSQLSGGERQRVGVARAMAAEPPVMLMDEPFGAVDPIVRERLQNEFLRLHRTLGTTVLFVTHDIDEAIKMGTRVAVMQQGGHLAQYAPPTELLAAAGQRVRRPLRRRRPRAEAARLLTVADVGAGATCRPCARRRGCAAEHRAPDVDGRTQLCAAAGRRESPAGLDQRRIGRRRRRSGADEASTRRRRWCTSRRRCATRCSMLLASAVQTAVVVDERGRYRAC